MNIRMYRAGGLAAALGFAAVIAAGCAAIVDPYSNTSTCEHALRDALAQKSDLPLKITHTGVGIDGSRVVIEGTTTGHLLKTSAPASGASAASAPSAASAATAATAASGAVAAPAATPAFVAPAGGYSTSGLTANSASQMNAAAAGADSNGGILSLFGKKKKQQEITPIAGECLFDGKSLSAFHWLAPALFVAAPVPASDAAQ